MTLHVFLIMLLACSILTTLTVEGIKKMFTNGESKRANIVAAVVAIVLAVAIGILYAVLFTVPVTIQYVVIIAALCFLSWLCAMVGYDKVVQAIHQITGKDYGN